MIYLTMADKMQRFNSLKFIPVNPPQPPHFLHQGVRHLVRRLH